MAPAARSDAAPLALPLAGQPAERRDAAANRERILCAARRVLAERGAEGLSMNAVAAAAGVGKGTLFRRFGDRDGLTEALLNAHTTVLQDAFLSGPPPLGPGAPPRERLIAFVGALAHLQIEHLDLVLAAERIGPSRPPVYATYLLHLRTLLAHVDPRLDAPVLASALLATLEPRHLARLLASPDVTPERVVAGVTAIARGLVAPV